MVSASTKQILFLHGINCNFKDHKRLKYQLEALFLLKVKSIKQGFLNLWGHLTKNIGKTEGRTEEEEELDEHNTEFQQRNKIS